MNSPLETNERIMRLPDVLLITGLKRSSLYKLIKQGYFPRQIRLSGGRSVGWFYSEILIWILSRKKTPELTTPAARL